MSIKDVLLTPRIHNIHVYAYLVPIENNVAPVKTPFATHFEFRETKGYREHVDPNLTQILRKNVVGHPMVFEIHLPRQEKTILRDMILVVVPCLLSVFRPDESVRGVTLHGWTIPFWSRN